MNARLLTGGLCAAVILLLAGCGGGEDDDLRAWMKANTSSVLNELSSSADKSLPRASGAVGVFSSLSLQPLNNKAITTAQQAARRNNTFLDMCYG